MNKRFTLEQRIARLERAIKNETHTRKFESFESDLDVDGARAAANRVADQFCRMIGVDGATLDDLGHDVIESPMYGWLTVNDTDEIEEDPDARFAFQYSLNGTDDDYTIVVHPTDKSVCLMNDGGEYIDPKGRPFTSDMADLVAFPLSKWKGFDLSMIDDEDGYNVEADDDFNDYYDESCKRSSKSTIVGRVARLEKLLSRKSR